jgi:uncharacterized protein YkwD
MNNRVIVSFLFAILIATTANTQTVYKLKECNVSFTSSEELLAIYDNPGYAVFKNPYIEVTLNTIRFIEVNGLENELLKRFPEKEFTISKKSNFSSTKQKGQFIWASRKGSSYLFANGIILSDEKAILVEIKYDSRREEEVNKIVDSFCEKNSQPKPQLANNPSPNPSQNIVDKPKPQELPKQKPVEPIKEEPKTNPVQQQALKHPAVSHPNLIKLSPAQKKEFIDAHNRWRADVGIPPLKWSDDLENYAGEWAVENGKKNCKMVHRTQNEYGENLYWSSGMAFSPKGAVDSWGSEIKDYKGEVVGKSNGVVGHYTQIVWRTTTEVGCAAFQCGSALLVVCNYNPPGNWVGQHPYK